MVGRNATARNARNEQRTSSPRPIGANGWPMRQTSGFADTGMGTLIRGRSCRCAAAGRRREIGRATCKESECQSVLISVGVGAYKNKSKLNENHLNMKTNHINIEE